MRLSVRIPASGRLRDSVAMLWHWRDYEQAHAMERLMPNGEMTLVVNLHEDAVRVYDPADLRLTQTLRGSVLVGAQSQPMVIDSEEQRHVFGIQFRAGAAFAYFREPACEVANQHVLLDDLWCGAALRTRLLEAGGDVEAMFDLAERMLLERVREVDGHPAVRYAVRRLQHSPQGLTIAALADATGLSSRRFIQLFEAQVGLTPKVFGRLQRFQRAIGSVHGKPRVDWASVALDCGYYDQSHLIRDFREFAGMSPSSYWSSKNEHLNHVPVL